MVEALTVEEIDRIRRYLEDNKSPLDAFMREVVARLMSYAAGEGKRYVRVVVPRLEVKTAKSVIAKINRHRWAQKPGDKPYELIDDVKDLVGAKILCAYPSDVDAVLDWLTRQRTFKVSPSRKQAQEEMKTKERERGYRGYNFTLLIRESAGMKFPFELQVKTLTEEAWDAKTHDISYKPTEEIQPHLLDHMRLLSRALVVIDDQSEVLKSQIQREEQIRSFHQRAAVFLLLTAVVSTEELQMLRQLGFPEEYLKFKLSDSPKILSRIKMLQKTIQLNSFICRAYTLLALLDERVESQIEAATAIGNFANQGQSPLHYRVAAHSHWALGNFPQAIEYTEYSIKWLQDQLVQLDHESEEPETQEQIARLERELLRTKNQFVYWVCETRDNDKLSRASQYVEELDRNSTASLDTVGYFKTVFGNSPEVVDEGRELMRRAKEQAAESDEPLAEAFYLKHELLALKRLDEMFRVRAVEAGIYGGPGSG